jgi:hypothetical protein
VPRRRREKIVHHTAKIGNDFCPSGEFPDSAGNAGREPRDPAPPNAAIRFEPSGPALVCCALAAGTTRHTVSKIRSIFTNITF